MTCQLGSGKQDGRGRLLLETPLLLIILPAADLSPASHHKYLTFRRTAPSTLPLPLPLQPARRPTFDLLLGSQPPKQAHVFTLSGAPFRPQETNARACVELDGKLGAGLAWLQAWAAFHCNNPGHMQSNLEDVLQPAVFASELVHRWARTQRRP
ncbi:hypothetical protein BD289DRAFT_487578 [Coniella lustricola]|uniref:Uncharacterized protein n=1 Tax=Coniella lustricola TaxID=2025994 RepID=A0A2T2ZRN3_9PEZI|nr:hypothetical protein BD289DRAFT_487578 [Coniella lustricola]